jgi:hypothetical protein
MTEYVAYKTRLGAVHLLANGFRNAINGPSWQPASLDTYEEFSKSPLTTELISR